ncbi:uncharacterized protein LOC109813836 [Cajanus cajan]|nr:uncharacterized protein LOC109813836 [Cajanus cajan]
MVEMDASNFRCKKSKSLGFSKIWRFHKDIKLQTNSDGQDAFVLLSPLKKENNFLNKRKDGKCITTLSPHEKVYVMNRKRMENSKQKSFLPYRPNLIGFFTNKNRFSRNVNPF